MYDILALYEGQLIPVDPSNIFMDAHSAICEIKRYWTAGCGHEYFAVRRIQTGEIVAELARPHHGAPCEGSVRFPNGLRESFRIEAMELEFA